MATLEILLQRKNDAAWPVIALETRPGEFLPLRSEGTLALDLDALRACALPREYGALLGRALFHDDLRDGFTRALTQARSSSEALRVLLTVEDPALKPLHWERLCAPFNGGWDFLALHQETPFSLYLPSLTDRRFPAIGRRDLRALLLVAGPQDLAGDYQLAPFDVPATVQAIRDALAPLPCDVLASVDGAVGAPDLNTLCERITAGRYTLLHIVCHAAYDSKTGETRLYLPGDEGRPVTATRLIERLSRLQGNSALPGSSALQGSSSLQGGSGLHGSSSLPHFIFLMACQSAAPEAETGLGGLGQRLVRELGSPAVLAMTEPVSIKTANALASAFYARLAEHGEPDLALSESLAGLMGRVDVTVPAVFSRLGGRPLFSDALDRPLTPAEIAHGLERLASFLPERAPVLVDSTAALSARLLGQADESGLSAAAKQEREAGLQEANALSEQVLDLSFPALALDKPVPAYDARCPFPGLAPFRTADRAFFFGRESLVQTLLRRLQAHPFLAVLGASGSGKSSVVLAGLAPAWSPATAAASPPGAAAPAQGEQIYLTPGADPPARLRAALEGAPSPSALLVVDQFEEVFTLCRDEDARCAFIDALLSHASPLVITMRADFLGECAPYPALRAAIQAHTELVAPMNGAELRRAIEQQAAAAGLRFEADLADDILEDVGAAGGRAAEPGAMPLLQHALLLLWQRRRGRWLLLAEYRAFGTVREAIAHTAGQIYDGLSPSDQVHMRDIFLRLTRLDDSAVPQSAAPGSLGAAGALEEHRDTRRRAALDELVPAGGSRSDTLRLVSRLADARLVISGPNPVTGQDEVEVAHEALIRYWPQLRRWLEEDRAALRAAEGVREAAQEWLAAGRDENLLVHRGGRLEDALELEQAGVVRLNQLELDYLRACQALVQRERLAGERRRRATVAVALVVAVVMTALAIWGVSSAREARARATDVARQAQTATYALGQSEISGTKAADQALAAKAAQSTAEAQAKISQARQLAVQVRDLLNNRQDLLGEALDQAMTAYQLHPEPLTAQVLSDTLNISPVWRGKLACQGENVFAVSSAVFSPDESRLAAVCSGSGPDTLEIWDLSALTRDAQAQPAWQASGGASPFVKVAFTPDGGRIITGAADGTLKVWAAPAGQVLKSLSTGMDPAKYVLSPDGRRAVVSAPASKGEKIIVYDLEAGRQVSSWQVSSHLGLLSISPEGNQVVITYDNGTVEVWNADTGQNVKTYQFPETEGQYIEFKEIDFVFGDIYVVFTHLTRTITVWDVMGERAIFEKAVDYGIRNATLSPERYYVAAGADDGSVYVFYTTDGTQVQRFKHAYLPYDTSGEKGSLVGGSTVQSVVFSPDKTMVLSRGDDQTIRLWSIRLGGEISRVGLPLAEDHLFASGASLRTLAVAAGGALDIYQLGSGKEIRRTYLPGRFAGSLLLSPDGSQVLSIVDNRAAATWDAASGRGLAVVEHAADIAGMAFSPDSARAVTADKQGAIQVWDAHSGQVLQRMSRAGSDTIAVAYSSDGQRILSGSRSGLFTIWDAATGKAISSKQLDPDDYEFAFSPDGWSLALEGQNAAKLMLYDLHTWKGQAVPSLSKTNFAQIAFSPDGSWLVSGDGDGLVEVFDARSGAKRFDHTNDDAVITMRFSADGRILAAGGAVRVTGGEISFFDLGAGKYLDSVPLKQGNDTFQLSPDGHTVLTLDGNILPGVGGQAIGITNPFNTIMDGAIFSRDGSTILIPSEDGGLAVLDWRPEHMLALACARGYSGLSQEQWKAYAGDQAPYQPICPKKGP